MSFLVGLFFGRIKVETPKYEVLRPLADGYEVRQYGSSVVAEVTYDPAQFSGDKDGGFALLVNYIGLIGKPQNSRPEKIAMTVPVITKAPGEKIAMTVPVVTKEGGEGGSKAVTMQFILPSKYAEADQAPKPVDERVVIREEPGRKFGVVKFGGVATEAVVKSKVENLRESLQKDGYKVVGDHLLARYNPTWSLPLFRTNEVMLPIE